MVPRAAAECARRATSGSPSDWTRTETLLATSVITHHDGPLPAGIRPAGEWALRPQTFPYHEGGKASGGVTLTGRPGCLPLGSDRTPAASTNSSVAGECRD